MCKKPTLSRIMEIDDASYIDDGVLGTTFNHPGVQRLLEDAKIGRINVIIVKPLSFCGQELCGLVVPTLVGFFYIHSQPYAVFLVQLSLTKRRNQYQFDKNKYDHIHLQVSKGKKEVIKIHADKQGGSLNGFINRAINETMKREGN